MKNYIAVASNVAVSVGCYTEADFRSEYPQFFSASGNSWVPSGILASLIAQANACISPDKWCESTHYAAGLFVAHKATLYLKSYKENSGSAAEAAASGQVIGTVKSAALGDTSISYDDTSAIRGTEMWGDLNATTYGQELASMARMVGMGGSYVI